MARIVSVGLCVPPYRISQEKTVEFVRELFQDSFHEIERLLNVFENGQIKERHFSVPLEWFREDHTFAEKNEIFIEKAVQFGTAAITECLQNPTCLREPVPFEDIEAIFYISSSGLSTPSIEAKLMNQLPFRKTCKRIPIWGLGCAGGAAGLSRAFEYCKAFPKAKVLVLSVELCSLTFQKNDCTKSNLVGSSLFADGVACALVTGLDADLTPKNPETPLPRIETTQSMLMPDSEDVMGWSIRNEGFFVVFSKDIPTIIRTWVKSNVHGFLEEQELAIQDIEHFVAHPGGKKVLDAYVETFGIVNEKIDNSLDILTNYGNMSSATILYVLKKFLENGSKKGDLGLVAAVGPGFCSELLLLRWE